MRHFTLIFLFAAACGSKSPATTTAHSSGPDCKAVAGKLAGESSVQDKDSYGSALQSRCQTDKWSDESRACLAEKGEAGPCVLTDQQRSGIEQERARALEQAQNKKEAVDGAAK